MKSPQGIFNFPGMTILLILQCGTAFVQGAAGESISPHWKVEGCRVCHDFSRGSASRFRAEEIDAVCGKCHDRLDHSSIHPVNLPVPPQMTMSMDSGYAEKIAANRGKITCTVCHDLILQCDLTDVHENTAFLRITNTSAIPGLPRGTICFSCHNLEAHQKLDPHQQVDEAGKPNLDTCVHCHSLNHLPQQTTVADHTLNQIMTPVSNSRQLCENCHRVRPHPADTAKHLGAPGMYTVSQLTDMQAKLNIRLPLDPQTGEIHCATCHNPHASGIITDPQLATGADTPHRLRAQLICDMCHDL